MPKPVANKPVYKVVELSGGAAVIELKSVTAPEQTTTSEEIKLLAREFRDQQASRDMGAVLDYLKSKSEIIRNEEL